MKSVLLSVIYVATVVVGNAVEKQPRITMGQEAMLGQFPWFAFINGYNDSSGAPIGCGGSLVTSQFVLTAASCVINITSVQIQLGTNMEYYLHDNTYFEESCAIIPHWRYIKDSWNYNAALIRLSTPTPLTKFIKPIALSGNYYSNLNAGAYIMGGGKRYANDWYGGILRWTKVQTISNDNCRVKLRDTKVTEQMICAEGLDNPWQSACYGDEGSPMVLKENGIWKQIGIISFISEIGCGLEQPFLNTQAYAIIDWVSEITGAGHWL